MEAVPQEMADILVEEDRERMDQDGNDSGGEAEVYYESSEEEDDDPDGMTISGIERAWALEIKGVVEGTPSPLNEGIKPVSDMEYAHYALTSRGCLEEALMKMRSMQMLKAEYRIDDSPEQAEEFLEIYMNLSPQFLLHLDLCPDSGDAMCALDLSKKNAGLLHMPGVNPEKTWRMIAIFFYYTMRTVQPSLSAIRGGFVYLFEGDGFDWINMDMEYERRLHDELWASYPWIARAILVYNTNSVTSIFMNLLKGFASDEKAQTIQMGCQVEDEDEPFRPFHAHSLPRLTLRDVYLQPNAETAQKNLIRRAIALLKTRNENERSFKL